MGNRHFTPQLFRFLRELEANNERGWWEHNKDRYNTLVRDPALAFISDFGPRLAEISPHFVADPRTVGGSLMRPYRDVRFSKDKTPYKTNVGIQFRHESGKDVHAPGFYIHLEPAGSFAGAGLWSPETRVAHAIRQKINDEPERWATVAHSSPFSDSWTLSHPEESLKRLPAQYDSQHPHADDMRLKSFIAGHDLTQKEVTSADFVESLADRISRASGFTAFLCEAVGLPY